MTAGGVTTDPDPSRKEIPKRHPVLKWALRILVAIIVIPIIQVALLRFIDPPLTAMMFFKAMENVFSGERVVWSHDNVSRDEIHRSFYSALVAAEDQRFWQHNGFDLKEIDKAQRDHERRPKKPMRGASTISQQVAKNLFLPPWRSFIRKGIEAYYTLLIELMWPKQRILHMYANIVELAPNVYGAQEGARHHFKRSAKKLTPQQSSLLAAVLPNPARWSASKPTSYIRRRAARIQRQMQGIPTNIDEETPE